MGMYSPTTPTCFLAPSLWDQPLLPSRPAREFSKTTLPVSSTPPLAEPMSTTQSSLLDGEPKTTETTLSSRTLGEPHGETRDTSRLPLLTELVSAVSTRTPSAPHPTEDPSVCIV